MGVFERKLASSLAMLAMVFIAMSVCVGFAHADDLSVGAGDFAPIGNGVEAADDDSSNGGSEPTAAAAGDDGDSDEGSSKVPPDLSVGIDYVPVPKGQYAFLVAVPNQGVGSARFGFTWERSTDGGETWASVGADSAQALRVMTDDEHIGNWYRVTLETDLIDEGTGEARTAVSEPMEIVEVSGYTVVLDYTPPIAGDWAVFQAHVLITDGSSPTTEYCWERSTDGGATWEGINGGDAWAADDALRVKTNPIAAGGDVGGGSEAVLTFVRVRALASDGRSAISNAQALTVRSGGESGGGSDDDSAGQGLGSDGDSGGNADAGAGSGSGSAVVAAAPAGIADGASATVGGAVYKVTSNAASAVTFQAAPKSKKSVTVPASVTLNGKKYDVAGIAKNAFKGSKAKKVTVKSTKLTKKSVKGCFKGAKKLKTVKVPKAKKKAYKKIFAKKVVGKKVAVK